MRLRNLFIIPLLLLVFSCSQEEPKVGFYHWEQQFNLDSTATRYLKETNSSVIYVRYFDVVWSSKYEAPIPVSILNVKSTPAEGIEVVPTIYITVDAMQRLENNSSKINDLAKRTAKKIKTTHSNFSTPLQKVQVDCDWNESTQSSYFSYLKQLKAEMGESILISSTIRLHQVKYFQKTGIPPVDEGMLMFYNMGKVQETSENNSILNQKIATQYFKNFDKYPLKLNVALPVFSWGVEFKDDKIVDLNANITRQELEQAEWLEKIEPDLFRVKEAGEINKNRFQQGNTIRYEAAEKEDLLWAVKKLRKQIRNDEIEVVFYNLESANTINYSPALLTNCAKQMNR